MTREELEATVRAQLTRAVANALQAGVPSTGIMNRATEEILAAADAYRGMTPRPVTAEAIAAAKRDAASWASRPVHWQKPGAAPNVAVCHGRVTRAEVSSERHRVTCGTCQETRSWRDACAGEVVTL